MLTDSILLKESERKNKIIQLPYHIYVPTYGLTGVAFPAAMPPNETWGNKDYGPNSAVFDNYTIHELDKLVTGNVDSWDTLDTAELALKAILLHERLYWIVPSVLVVNLYNGVKTGVGKDGVIRDDTGSVVYPKHQEPQAFMDVLRKAGASSYAVYSAHVDIKDKIPVSGSRFWMGNYKRLMSKDVGVVNDVFNESFEIPFYKDSFYSSPKAIGAASYFGRNTDRNYEYELIKKNSSSFPEKVFRKLDESWAHKVSGSSIGLNIKVGPFLSIVLSRAKDRNNIPETVIQLRDEMADSRKELWELFSSALTEKRSVVAVKNIHEINDAIQSIVPASFRGKDRPVSFLWNTSYALGNILAGNPLPFLKFAGDFLLNKDKDFAQVSSIGVTKKITQEIKNIDSSLIEQLNKHLTARELIRLGVLY